ncbi:hypothetical protein [Pseudomonas paraveronii]|uniref:hypothetical protein n=1 Tax=Pseudomonas paraveronii TaxID=3040598 RepID=UPI002AB22222|nr:hypothetical protein [Pseudomonas sp. V3/K/3/5]
MTQDELEKLNLEIDKHNEAQERTVQRAQDMVKMLFLVSGGALAVCANFFSTVTKLSPIVVIPIQTAWICLTSSMLMFGLTLLLLLARDYRFGENRAESFDSGKPQTNVSPWWDRFIWLSGLIGFFLFIAGMGAFCFAALLYLKNPI